MKSTLARVSCILGIIRTEERAEESAAENEPEKFERVIVRVETNAERVRHAYISLEENGGLERGSVLRRHRSGYIASFGSVPFGSYNITAYCGQTGVQLVDAQFVSDKLGRSSFSNVERPTKSQESWGAFGPAEFADECEKDATSISDLFPA